MAETTSPPPSASSRGLVETDRDVIGRQIALPWSKAIEISYKSVKIRFWRSLITASGIVLAITFLMSTLSSGVTTQAIKTGIPVQLAAIKGEQGRLKAQVRGLAGNVSADAAAKKRFDDALAADDIKVAHATLANELRERPEREAGLAELKDVLGQLLAVSLELERLNKMRLEMIKRGESVPVGEGAEAQAAAGVAQDKDLEEARSRQNWLIALALCVAFVGIMNSMLMSVTERFREIGTMKCLGALDSFIVKLFLIESSMMGFIGTSLGVLLGLVFSLGKYCWDFDLGILSFVPGAALGQSVVWALLIGTGLAFFGAIIPAIIAARMEPVAAMRVDQ